MHCFAFIVAIFLIALTPQVKITLDKIGVGSTKTATEVPVKMRILATILAGLAGILVMLAAAISLAMLITNDYLFGSPTMMEQWQQLLLQRERVWFAEGISVTIILAGIAMLVGSVLLYLKPEQSESWGYLILMGAITSLFWLGGFLIGPILGVISGIIAIYCSRRKASTLKT